MLLSAGHACLHANLESRIGAYTAFKLEAEALSLPPVILTAQATPSDRLHAPAFVYDLEHIDRARIEQNRASNAHIAAATQWRDCGPQSSQPSRE